LWVIVPRQSETKRQIMPGLGCADGYYGDDL
jgi:hypothetical protein